MFINANINSIVYVRREQENIRFDGACIEWGFFRNKIPSRARAPAHPPGPEKPPKTPCQKVVPPPCKNVQKMGFLGEKACIFGQFVHNFAQK
jgi:hypothetical protein